MALSVREQRILAEIADRLAAEDPAYARRLADFGGHDFSGRGFGGHGFGRHRAGAKGLPGRWAALPVAIVAIALAAIAGLFAAVTAQGSAPDDARVHHTAPHR